MIDPGREIIPELLARVTELEKAFDELVEPTPREKPIDGWDAIASEVGLSRSAAQRYAGERDETPPPDPLPVYLYLGRVLAYPGALKEWKDRHTIPLTTARRLKHVAGTPCKK